VAGTPSDAAPRAERRDVVFAVAGVVLGFVGGWCLHPSTPPSSVQPDSSQRRRDAERTLLPRRPLAEQNTILVGADPDAEEALDPDGTARLKPAGAPRVLTFADEDVDPARSAVDRFVAALRPDLVRPLGPGAVDLDGIRVQWRVEGEGPGRTLRVVALPEDPYTFERRPARVAEAIGEWTIVNGVAPATMSGFEARAAVVTCIHAPRARAKVSPFVAAKEEFRARGLTLAVEDAVQSQIVELVRDAKGVLLWSFVWEEDQQHGTYAIRHHADPFDTVGEQALLLAIFRRALGREVRIDW